MLLNLQIWLAKSSIFAANAKKKPNTKKDNPKTLETFQHRN